MNNTTKTAQELAQEAFIAKLSGIAEYKNPNEIWWENEYGNKITIEFINNSVSNVIVRGYYENGNKKYEVEYQNGKLNGRTIYWYKNGDKEY
jgi:antitoxin component YwqK of YwqJK toxin-antitoxin module